MKYYTLYKITNNINGKYYIGKHITDEPYDNYMGSGKAIKNAIKKYGKENFSKEILCLADTEEDMNTLEEKFVNYNDNMCYNMTVGGKGGWHYVNANQLSNTPEMLKSKSEKMKKFWTEERKLHKSEQMKEYNIKNGKDRYSVSAKKMHSDPTFKDKFSNIMTEVNNREDKRKDASEKIKTKWKEETFRERMSKRIHGSNSNTMKEKWKDPMFRQMMIDRRKKNEANKDN
jgi:hypothetical protein